MSGSVKLTIDASVRFWPNAVVQWALLNVRFRWKADVQKKHAYQVGGVERT